MDLEKVQAVENWEAVEKLKDMQIFTDSSYRILAA
jgi:hypothetical protein